MKEELEALKHLSPVKDPAYYYYFTSALFAFGTRSPFRYQQFGLTELAWETGVYAVLIDNAFRDGPIMIRRLFLQ